MIFLSLPIIKKRENSRLISRASCRGRIGHPQIIKWPSYIIQYGFIPQHWSCSVSKSMKTSMCYFYWCMYSYEEHWINLKVQFSSKQTISICPPGWRNTRAARNICSTASRKNTNCGAWNTKYIKLHILIWIIKWCFWLYWVDILDQGIFKNATNMKKLDVLAQTMQHWLSIVRNGYIKLCW